jgi:hypothetical protein
MMDILNWFAADRDRVITLFAFTFLIFAGLRSLICAAKGRPDEGPF